MKLSQWAKLQGISYKTAWGMFNRKQIPSARKLPTGTIIVDNETIIGGREDKMENLIMEVISLLKQINEKIK